MYIVPLTSPGPAMRPVDPGPSTTVLAGGIAKPLTDGPGWTPRSPRMVVGPVLVTVEAPSTANDSAVPSNGAANPGGQAQSAAMASTMADRPTCRGKGIAGIP